jgi:aconitate hydratase
VRAVIAESFERIHRSNLIGMGVLPLQFTDGESWRNLGLDGSETFDIPVVAAGAVTASKIECRVTRPDGTSWPLVLKSRVDLETEARYLAEGGIMNFVLREMIDLERAVT